MCLGHVVRVHAHHVGEVLPAHFKLGLLPCYEHVVLPLPTHTGNKNIVMISNVFGPKNSVLERDHCGWSRFEGLAPAPAYMDKNNFLKLFSPFVPTLIKAKLKNKYVLTNK